jgi:hypothetical protein
MTYREQDWGDQPPVVEENSADEIAIAFVEVESTPAGRAVIEWLYQQAAKFTPSWKHPDPYLGVAVHFLRSQLDDMEKLIERGKQIRNSVRK